MGYANCDPPKAIDAMKELIDALKRKAGDESYGTSTLPQSVIVLLFLSAVVTALNF